MNTSTPIAHSATGLDKKAYVSLNVGAQVALVMVNIDDTTSNGLGSSTFTTSTAPLLRASSPDKAAVPAT